MEVAHATEPDQLIGEITDLYFNEDNAESAWIGDKIDGGEFLLDNLVEYVYDHLKVINLYFINRLIEKCEIEINNLSQNLVIPADKVSRLKEKIDIYQGILNSSSSAESLFNDARTKDKDNNLLFVDYQDYLKTFQNE